MFLDLTVKIFYLKSTVDFELLTAIDIHIDLTPIKFLQLSLYDKIQVIQFVCPFFHSFMPPNSFWSLNDLNY